MRTIYMIYLLEVLSLILTWIIGIIIIKVRKKTGIFKLFGVSSVIFIIIFGVSFALERPLMDIKEIEVIEVKEEQEIYRPKTTYHFMDITERVNIKGNIEYNKIGEYNVQFEVKTWIGKYSKNIKVKIVDTKAPEIILDGGEKYNISYSKEFEEPGYKAIDEHDGDITDKVITTKEEIDEENYNIRYSVQDQSGNKTEKVREVRIIDDVSPEITLKGAGTITINLNGKYEEKGAKAIDEKDGDLTNKIKIEGKVDTTKEGTYTVTYRVSDSKGNEGVKTRKVIVKKSPVYNPIPKQSGSKGTKGTIYLTFDDGPSTNITPKTLDILKRKNVKATFFILNYNTEGEKIVKREVAEGHSVGIHGYSHRYKDIYKSVDTYMANITKLQNKIKASTGVNTTITRFPGGSSNTVSRYNPGIMTVLTKEVVKRGYKYYDWNVSSGDAGEAITAEQVYNNVTSRLSKSKQNIVLLHDYAGNTKTLDALERIIDFGLQNGYAFSKITQSTPMVTHTPNN